MGMGERKLRAKQSKQLTDDVSDQLHETNLLTTIKVETELTYECIRDPEDAPIHVGNRVRLVDMNSQILVFVRVNPVGYVVPNQAEGLRTALKLTERKGHSIMAEVVDVSELTPTFVVRIGK